MSTSRVSKELAALDSESSDGEAEAPAIACDTWFIDDQLNCPVLLGSDLISGDGASRTVAVLGTSVGKGLPSLETSWDSAAPGAALPDVRNSSSTWHRSASPFRSLSSSSSSSSSICPCLFSWSLFFASIRTSSTSLLNRAILLCRPSSSSLLSLSLSSSVAASWTSPVPRCLLRIRLLDALYDLRFAPMRSEKSTLFASTCDGLKYERAWFSGRCRRDISSCPSFRLSCSSSVPPSREYGELDRTVPACTRSQLSVLILFNCYTYWKC